MEKEEFSLEKWKTDNYNVVTKDERKVRIICTNSLVGTWPIIGLIHNESKNSEECISFCINGREFEEKESKNDLFLVQKRWIPKEGDYIHYIMSEGSILKTKYYIEDRFLNSLIEAGNYFQTYQEAEEMVKKIKKLLKEE